MKPDARDREAGTAGWVLQARGVVKSFGAMPGHRALDGVTLEAPAGRLTALVGPDGAGKTTLLRLAAGLLTRDAGDLRVLGSDVARDPQTVQDRISYMPQRFGLYEDLSVQENLDLYADLHGVPPAERRERFARMLAMTDLAGFTQRPAGKLSGGMKQKLGLACTLVRSPELLLLDEPTVGVDPLSRRELWRIVQQLVGDEHLSAIVSTAYLDEAERCDHVILMADGKVLAQGSPAAFRERAQGRCFVVRPAAGVLPRELQARLIDDRREVADAAPVGGEVRYLLRAGTPSGITRAASAPRAVAPRLEDGVMQLLAEARPDEPFGPAGFDGTAGPLLSPAATPQGRMAATATASALIEVRDLVRRFGDFTAVASTSFDVRRGEIFGLLGPNGAGKTTTFRMMCGLLPASSGRLRVAGYDLRTARAAARSRVGYVSQKFALYGNLNVIENLEFFGGAYGLRGPALRSRIDAVLREFDLVNQRTSRSGDLPGGFKQRLAMATALLHQPPILFLDEPTSGIDPLARRAFWRRITALAAQGTTVIVTTHFMEEAEYCDRILIQDAGHVLALGTPDEVRARVPGARDMNEAFIGIVEDARRGAASTPAPASANAAPAAAAPGPARPARPGSRSEGFARRLRALTRKEFRQLWRDRSNLAIGLVLPVLLILLFGYGLSLDIRHAPVAVVLEDTSPSARDAVEGLSGTTFLDPVWLTDMREAQRMMRARRVDGIVRVPVDFSRRLAQGSASIQLLLHGTDATSAASLAGYVDAAIAGWNARQADRAGASGSASGSPGVTLVDRLWFNAANTSTWYLVPGLIVLIMTLVGGFLTSMVVAREWERGTLEALFVTPVRPLEILLAKIIPYFCVGMFGMLLCVVAARALFDVPLQGSLWVLLASAVLYMVVALCLGLVISAVTRNQFVASQVAVVATFLPALMLSGFLFDLRNVPTAIQWLAQVLPATHFVSLVKSSFLSGDYFALILRDWAVLAVQAAVLIALARSRMAKTLDR